MQEKVKNRSINIKLAVTSCLAIAAFVSGLFLAFQDKSLPAGTCFAAALMLYIFLNLKDFESFKAFGIEAKTRELDEKLREAENALEKIHKLTEAMAEVTFRALPYIGRWDSALSNPEMYSIASKLKTQLQDAGTSDHEIEKIMMPWFEVVIVDLSLPIYQAVHQTNKNIIARISGQLVHQSDPIGHNDETLKTTFTTELLLSNEFEKTISEEWSNSDKLSLPKRLENLIRKIPNISPIELDGLETSTESNRREAVFFALHKEFNDLEKWLRS